MTAKHETDFLLYLEPPTSTWLLATAMDESGALDVLGLSDRESYSAAEVRRAYRRMALLYHPDKLQSPSKITEEEVKGRFRDITSAKNFLLEKLLGHGVSVVPTPPKNPPTFDPPTVLRQRRARTARWCKRVEPVIPVQPSEPPRLVVWACHVCDMAAMGGYSPGARKDRVIPCVQPGPHSLCFCGHPLRDHKHLGTPSQDGWERCERAGCLCARFNYVQPHSTCTCGHSSVEHSAKAFFACKVPGCNCQTYHDPGTCHVCGHDWVSHRSELRFSVPSKPRGKRSSSSSSSEPDLRMAPRPRPQRPVSANPVAQRQPRGVFEVKRPLSARAPGSAGKHVARVMEALSARGGAAAPGAAATPTSRSLPTRPETPRSSRPRTPQPRSYVPRKPDEPGHPGPRSSLSSSPDASPIVAVSPEVRGSPVEKLRGAAPDLPWLSRGPVRVPRVMEVRSNGPPEKNAEREQGGRWAHPTMASGF